MEFSRVAKTVGFGLLAYVGLVVVFETLLGVLQPDTGDTIVIATTDASGVSTDRVLGRDFAGGRHYASANHWPRAWYNNALENPRVQVTMDGTTADYIAVPVDDEEHERVAAEIGNGIVFKIMVGFAPQRFLRLDPVETLRQRHDHVSPAVSAAEHGGGRRRHLGIDAGDGVVLAHVLPPAC